MAHHNTYAGEATHAGRRFQPQGKLITYHSPRKPVYDSEDVGAAEDAQRLGGGGYSARIFVGLNVKQKQKFSVDDVVEIVWKVRKKQQRSGDASILAQKGIYEDNSGKRVTEPSAQIIIIDFSGAPKKVFAAEMITLAETLCKQMKQETVILEIQRRGVVTDVFTIT